jgi:hypothetical protein
MHTKSKSEKLKERDHLGYLAVNEFQGTDCADVDNFLLHQDTSQQWEFINGTMDLLES